MIACDATCGVIPSKKASATAAVRDFISGRDDEGRFT
jgi:hypothetical protein